MKIGTLIASIFMLVGAVFQTLIIVQFLPSSMTWNTFQNLVSVPPPSFDIITAMGYIIYFFGLTFAFLTAITAPKILLKIGGILCALASLGLLALWLLGGMYVTPLYEIVNSFFMLCLVIYLIGIIFHRKYNRFAMVTGILLFVYTILNGLFGFYVASKFYLINDPLHGSTELMFIKINLLTQLGSAVIFFLHNLIFSFSKKKSWMDDGAEDTLSVEKGAAFASYVPKDTKEKKPAKGTKDQEVVFKF